MKNTNVRIIACIVHSDDILLPGATTDYKSEKKIILPVILFNIPVRKRAM